MVRKVGNFGRRYMLANLAYVLPGGIFLWLMWRTFSHSPAFYLSLAGFLICVVLGIWLDVLRLRRFRCPECQARLPWHPKRPGEQLSYQCSKCNIIWETDLFQPED